MTKVDFYKIPGSGLQSRLQFACRLTEKAYSLGHRIHIQLDSQQDAKLLDDMLWQFAPSSFIPHALLTDAEAEPVSIGTDLAAASHADVLINLAGKPCQIEDRFNRISEVLSSDDESVEQGRARYRFYQSKDYGLEYHEL